MKELDSDDCILNNRHVFSGLSESCPKPGMEWSAKWIAWPVNVKCKVQQIAAENRTLNDNIIVRPLKLRP